MSAGEWMPIADGVWVRRYEELDQSIGLIVGDDGCLVIDTRSDASQGAELAAAVREITPQPWSVVYTHGHYDHIFGTSAFGDTDIWAHRNCRAFLDKNAERKRTELIKAYRDEGDHERVEAISRTEIVLPNQSADSDTELSIGGRPVRLIHPGPAHTDHDLIVHVPDADVVFAGDLVEQGAPPQFSNADPLRWPDALVQIMEIGATMIVPGHGAPVGNEFVAEQHAELLVVAELCRAVRADELSLTDAIARSPYPDEFIRPALAPARIPPK